MNGAESLIRTLTQGGVDTCFMNPGTSEMHFVSALDQRARNARDPCLFEGVASGAADGYARMAGRPASTLFHLGPGLANALANMHNAGRARVPMVNSWANMRVFIGKYDAPLTADIEAIGKPSRAGFEHRQRHRRLATGLRRGDRRPPARARQYRYTYSACRCGVDRRRTRRGRGRDSRTRQCHAHDSHRGRGSLLGTARGTAILLGGSATQGAALFVAGRIAAATGARLLAPFCFRPYRAGRRPAECRRDSLCRRTSRSKCCANFHQLILVGATRRCIFRQLLQAQAF